MFSSRLLFTDLVSSLTVLQLERFWCIPYSLKSYRSGTGLVLSGRNEIGKVILEGRDEVVGTHTNIIL